ncbi:MAG: response regulator [Pseudanabaenaceae cyanobacterium]
MKILLIEDDAVLTKLLVKYLAGQGYTVETAADSKTGLELARWHHDLIIMDAQLPKMDGVTLCRQIRAQGINTPILMLTSNPTPEEITQGLDSGADEYMTKPCNLPELLARIRALLRRTGEKDTVDQKLTWGKLVLDPVLKEVTYAGEPIHLRPKEYSLLELFLRSPRQIFDREMILDRLWTIDDSPTKFAVTNLIKDLRQRLHNAGMQEELIETVYGSGYRLKPSPSLQSVQSRFQESLPQRLKELEECIALRDYQRFQAVAHKLTGTLGTFGYGQATEIARSMETARPEEYPRLIKALHRALTIPTKSTYARPPAQVVFVGEDDNLAELLREELEDHHVEMAVVHSSQIVAWLKEHPKIPVVVVPLPSPQSLPLLQQVKETAEHSAVVVIDYANDTLDRRVELAGYGIDRYLSSSSNIDQISAQILELVVPPLSRPKIAIVDDDQFVLDYLTEKLVPNQVTVISISEPRDVWAVLQQHQPQLLLLDIEMPQYNGKQLCQVLRQSESFHDLPIVVITAHEYMREELFRLGATDVITKPISDVDINTRILARVGLH